MRRPEKRGEDATAAVAATLPRGAPGAVAAQTASRRAATRDCVAMTATRRPMASAPIRCRADGIAARGAAERERGRAAIPLGVWASIETVNRGKRWQTASEETRKHRVPETDERKRGVRRSWHSCRRDPSLPYDDEAPRRHPTKAHPPSSTAVRWRKRANKNVPKHSLTARALQPAATALDIENFRSYATRDSMSLCARSKRSPA